MYGPSQNGIKTYSLVEKLSCSGQMFFNCDPKLYGTKTFSTTRSTCHNIVHDYLILITFNEF